MNKSVLFLGNTPLALRGGQGVDATRAIIDCAERHDQEGLKSLLSGLAGVSVKIDHDAIVKRVVDLGCPGKICDVLLDHDLLYLDTLPDYMEEQKQYSGLGWLLGDRARIETVEQAQDDRRDTVDHEKRNCALDLLSKGLRSGQMGRGLDGIDMAHVLRRLGSNTQNLHEGMHLMDSVDRSETSPELYARMLEALTSDEVLRSAWPRMKPEKLEIRRAVQMEWLVTETMECGSLEDLAFLERVLEVSPRLTQAWNAYWQLEESQIDSPLLRLETEDSLAHGRDDIPPMVDRDLLDLAVRWPAEWALDAILNKTKGHELLLDRLRNDPTGGRVHLLMNELMRQSSAEMAGRLAEALGSAWRDANGNNLAHVVAKIEGSGAGNTRAMSAALKVLGDEILLSPNHQGETPLDLLRAGEAWQDKSLVSQVSRRLLRQEIAEPPRKTPKPTPRM